VPVEMETFEGPVDNFSRKQVRQSRVGIWPTNIRLIAELVPEVAKY
jgi:hypothetical protein